jgi:hypothetical protein
MNAMITDIPIPEKLDIIPEVDGITLRRKRFHWKYNPMAIFARFGDSFLVLCPAPQFFRGIGHG